jgi:hypothetical protein
VDDPASGEPAGVRRNRVAHLDRSLLDRLALDLVAAGALDRARDARAHPQLVVRRVGDRVDIQLRDVTLDDGEFHRAGLSQGTDGNVAVHRRRRRTWQR